MPVFCSSQPHRPHWARLDRQRRPPGDAPSAFPRLGVVGNPREPSAQLDGSRQLSFLSEDSANCGSVGFGDNEHPDSMLARTTVGKASCVLPSICLDRNTAPREQTCPVGASCGFDFSVRYRTGPLGRPRALAGAGGDDGHGALPNAPSASTRRRCLRLARLNCCKRDRIDDIVHHRTARQVVHRFAQPLQHRTDANHMRRPLDRLVGGVASVEIGKNKHRRTAGNCAVRGLLASDAFDAGGVVLQRAVDQQVRALGAGNRQCPDNLVRVGAGSRRSPWNRKSSATRGSTPKACASRLTARRCRLVQRGPANVRGRGGRLGTFRPTGARSLQMALGPQELKIIATEPRLIANGIANIRYCPRFLQLKWQRGCSQHSHRVGRLSCRSGG